MNIMDRVQEHLESAIEYCNDYFVIALQGSQNYGIADAESDIDTKCLTIPPFSHLVFNERPMNTVHLMANDEHCDLKDMREYFKIIRKSNINFVEILFTPYYIVNPKYEEEWNILRNNNEKIARLNPARAVKCMAGMAKEKRHALCHKYPSRMKYIEEFGFDPKQLSHLLRIEYFVKSYIEGRLYKDCIYPPNREVRDFLLGVKRNLYDWDAEYAVAIADRTVESIQTMVDNFCEKHLDIESPIGNVILNDVLFKVISKSIKEQI